jgi:hypothetical protein
MFLTPVWPLYTHRPEVNVPGKKDTKLTELGDRMHCSESDVATGHGSSRAVTFGFALTCRHAAHHRSVTLIYCCENDVFSAMHIYHEGILLRGT